jgi:carotenoid 1,2-hydratase
MTERGRRDVERRAEVFRVGRSSMNWSGHSLIVEIDERASPLPTRIKGWVRIGPVEGPKRAYALDPEGRHRWAPLAPSAKVEARFSSPHTSWHGHGYLDSNEGDELPEHRFNRWDWLRTREADGSTSVIYDAQLLDGSERLIAAHFDHDGTPRRLNPGPREALQPGKWWKVARSARLPDAADAGQAPVTIERTFEDTPFYTRSLLSIPMHGQRIPAMHESLDAQMLRRPWVQSLLPFRMPRPFW